jgi:hypothetical protein
MNVITARNLQGHHGPGHEWTDRLRKSLGAFSHPGEHLTRGLFVYNWVGPHAAHEVYTVPLRTIAAADSETLHSLDRPACWRFIAGGQDHETVATGCIVTHEKHGLAPKVIAAMRSPEMARVLEHLKRVNHLPEVAEHPEHRYEVRILRIPELYVECIWLKSLGDHRDRFIPYGWLRKDTDRIKVFGERTLEINKAYTTEEFLSVVVPPAKELCSQRLRRDDPHPLSCPPPDHARVKGSRKPLVRTAKAGSKH